MFVQEGMKRNGGWMIIQLSDRNGMTKAGLRTGSPVGAGGGARTGDPHVALFLSLARAVSGGSKPAGAADFDKGLMESEEYGRSQIRSAATMKCA